MADAPSNQNSKKNLNALVASFDKSKLKKTDTTVTREDGTVVQETKDEYGQYKLSVVNKATRGYVADWWADFQVGEVLPGLIIGSQDVAHEIPILEEYKVTHILNAATYVKNLDPNRFTYMNININDMPDQNIMQYFPKVFDFIDAGRKDNGCVLVHCNAGVSRASTICIAYLMKTEGMTYKAAYEHVKEKRPKICPNPGFVSQLQEFEKQLKANKK